jgi:hypothetical protein
MHCVNNGVKLGDTMLSVLQVLLVLVTFACVVLAEPQRAEVIRPRVRPLIPPYYTPLRPNNGRLVPPRPRIPVLGPGNAVPVFGQLAGPPLAPVGAVPAVVG